MPQSLTMVKSMKLSSGLYLSLTAGPAMGYDISHKNEPYRFDRERQIGSSVICNLQFLLGLSTLAGRVTLAKAMFLSDRK